MKHEHSCKIFYVSVMYSPWWIHVLEFWDQYIERVYNFVSVMYSPWWSHVLEFWEKRNEDNILFIKYEDLQRVSLFGAAYKIIVPITPAKLCFNYLFGKCSKTLSFFK